MQPPTVLRVEAKIFVASVKGLELALVVLAGSAEQEVDEIEPVSAPEEQKTAVELSDGVSIDLVVVEFPAGLDGVRADHFGKIVEPLEGVVDLPQLVGVGSDGVVVEDDVLQTLSLRRERHDARSVRGPSWKP